MRDASGALSPAWAVSGGGAAGGEEYAEENGTFGLATILKRRRSGGEKLLAYRNGRRWHDVTAADINDYIREVTGGDFTAKDFRTWHATVLAAVGLAVSERAVLALLAGQA